jgi:hypothetical protein
LDRERKIKGREGYEKRREGHESDPSSSREEKNEKKR